MGLSDLYSSMPCAQATGASPLILDNMIEFSRSSILKVALSIKYDLSCEKTHDNLLELVS